MNFVLHGHAVSRGITIGYAHLVATARMEVAHYEVPAEDVEPEVERFQAAMLAAREDLAELKAQIPPGAPAEFGAFSSARSSRAASMAAWKRSTSGSTSSAGTS